MWKFNYPECIFLIRKAGQNSCLSDQQFLGNDVGVSPNTHVLLVANCKNSKRVFEFLYISLAAFYGEARAWAEANSRNGSENWSGGNKSAKEKWNHKPGRLFFFPGGNPFPTQLKRILLANCCLSTSIRHFQAPTKGIWGKFKNK